MASKLTVFTLKRRLYTGDTFEPAFSFHAHSLGDANLKALAWARYQDISSNDVTVRLATPAEARNLLHDEFVS